MESKDYESAYSLLKVTAGLFTTMGEEDRLVMVYISGRLGLHPIFADLGLWEKVKDLNYATRQEAKETDKALKEHGDEEEDDEYESAVATLYEMLGYGIPAEELARFASRIAEQNGWFRTDRGQALLLFARRLCVRREQGEESTAPKSDIDMMSLPSTHRTLPQSDIEESKKSVPFAEVSASDPATIRTNFHWIEYGWCHPAAKSMRRLNTPEGRRPGTQNLLNLLDETKLSNTTSKSSKLLKRSAVTSMAYIGSSMFVSGGLDGGVFMARPKRVKDESEADSYDVRGIHLDWGSSGSRYSVGSTITSLDGEYGVGSVSCLASTRSGHNSYQFTESTHSKKDTKDDLTDDDLLASMEGCRVVAGTTCGDLRVWSVRDVLSALFYANKSSEDDPMSRTYHRSGEGDISSFAAGARRATPDYTAGSSLTRFKFSLRGRALSGHRGGVSCIDVPSNVFRPDSIVSGGADGLIKLSSSSDWSRPSFGRRECYFAIIEIPKWA
jgi:hypothetical protein